MSLAIPITIDKKSLKNFGFIMAAMIPLVFGIVFPIFFNASNSLVPWSIGGGFLLWALIHPRTLKIVYIPWMRIGAVLGWINTRILLGIVFFILITPMAIIFKVMRKDPLRRELSQVNTYRVISDIEAINNMEKPY